jgi:hypothetical protein
MYPGFKPIDIILGEKSPTISIMMLYIGNLSLSHPKQESFATGAG